MADQPPRLVVATGRGKRSREYLVFYNSAIITLSFASAVPPAFTQDDWPNPIRRKQVQQPQQQPNLLLTTLAPQEEEEAVVQTPFSQNEWANPIRKAIRDYTYYQGQIPSTIPPILDLQSSVFPAFQPALPENILNRDSKVSLLWFNSVILPQTDNVPFAFGTPFYQTEHPNPVLRESWRDYSWSQSPFEITSSAPEAVPPAPFYQTKWPNPTLRETWRDYSWSQTPQIVPEEVPEAAGNPFYQTNWPNPLIRTENRVSLLWFNSVIMPRTDQPTPKSPFFQTDWPNPVLREAFRDYTWIQTPRTIPPLTVAADKRTFREALVSPPIRRIREREWGWTQSSIIEAIPAATAPPPPFFQTEFPNPIRRPFRDLTWNQSPYEITPSALTEVFYPDTLSRIAVLSNPIRRISPKEWGWTQSAYLEFVPAATEPPAPFYQTEHPNPVLRESFRDYTFIQTPFTGDIVASPPHPAPFYQTEFPNPVLREAFRDFTWTQAPKVPEAVVEVVTPEEPGRRRGGRPRGFFERQLYDALNAKPVKQEVLEVIEDVAQRQVDRLETDRQTQELELVEELHLHHLRMQRRYLELLSLKRQALIDEELERIFREKEEEEIFLLLAASL